jgi:hypothetical protein
MATFRCGELVINAPLYCETDADVLLEKSELIAREAGWDLVRTAPCMIAVSRSVAWDVRLDRRPWAPADPSAA